MRDSTAAAGEGDRVLSSILTLSPFDEMIDSVKNSLAFAHTRSEIELYVLGVAPQETHETWNGFVI